MLGQAYMRLSPGQCWLRGHAWQRPESPSQKPGRQTQSLSSDAPAGEDEWSSQGVAVPPELNPVQYEPAGHTSHGPPGGPEKPTSQMQPLSAVAGSAAGRFGFTFGETVTVLAGHVLHA